MEELLKNNSQYKGKQKKRLIDYFSVFERDIEGKVTCVSFPSKTNDPNHSEFPGAHVVGMFCFPLIRQCQTKELNSFVLTSTDYSHTYGAVLRFPINSTNIPDNNNTTTEDNNNNDNNNNGEQALCILSHYPFFKLFEGILKTMYEIFLNRTNNDNMKNIPPLERYLTYLIYEIPVPSRGEQLILTLSPTITSLYQTRSPVKNIPEVDYGSFQILFQYLSVENVVHIIEAILMEQRIVLMSENIRILAPIGEALLALIFPLQWQLIYIPMLPSYMTLSLKSPVNYIVGVHTSSVVDSEEDLELPAAVVVHLDQDKVINPLICEVMITSDESVDDIPKFPVKLRETLIKNLNQVVPEDIMNKDIDDVNNNNMDEMLKAIQWSSRVQAAFLNVFLKLLSSYTRYNKKISSPSSNDNGGNNTGTFGGNNVTFDSNGFLRSRMYLWRQFLSAMIQTQAFQEFLQAASRGDPQINEFDRYLVLNKANIHQGKSSNDINKMLFVPIVDGTKNVMLKCTTIDETPVIGADMRGKFLSRRKDIVEKGRFPNPDDSMAFPPRTDFQVTRSLEGKEIDHFRDANNNVIDESPMVQINTSTHKRGRHTREVSRLIVQKSLMRVESIDSINSGSRGGSFSSNNDHTLILSPSTYRKGSMDGMDDDGFFANLATISGNNINNGLKVNISTSSGGSNDNKAITKKEKMQQQKLLNETLSQPRHRRLATTPSQFTPGVFNRASNKRNNGSPSPSLASSQVFKPSPLRRTASSQMISAKNTPSKSITPDQLLYGKNSGMKGIVGSSSKGASDKSNNSLLSHFDAVRKALAKSRTRAERAEATAELSTMKLKEVHSKMVELQRLVLNQRNNNRKRDTDGDDGNTLSGNEHWKLKAALNKIEKLENKISAQEHKISLLQSELRQNSEFQSHLIDKIESKTGSSNRVHRHNSISRNSSVASSSSTSKSSLNSPVNKMENRQKMKIASMQFKQKSSKNLLYGLKSRYNNDMSKSTPNMKINTNLDGGSGNAARRRSSLRLDTNDSRYRNQYKISNRKNAEIRVLKEKVERLQLTLDRMRRLSESRKRRSSVVNKLKTNTSFRRGNMNSNNKISRSADPLKEKLLYIQKSLMHENQDVEQRVKDLESMKSLFNEDMENQIAALLRRNNNNNNNNNVNDDNKNGGTEKSNKRRISTTSSSSSLSSSSFNMIGKNDIISLQRDMKQVKEDMEFQIEGLLYINREIEKTVTHAKKKAKEFVIKNTQQQQLQRHKLQLKQQQEKEQIQQRQMHSKMNKKGHHRRSHNFNAIKRRQPTVKKKNKSAAVRGHVTSPRAMA